MSYCSTNLRCTRFLHKVDVHGKKIHFSVIDLKDDQ